MRTLPDTMTALILSRLSLRITNMASKSTITATTVTAPERFRMGGGGLAGWKGAKS